MKDQFVCGLCLGDIYGESGEGGVLLWSITFCYFLFFEEYLYQLYPVGDRQTFLQ